MQIAAGTAPVIVSGERANQLSITMFNVAYNLCLSQYMGVFDERVFTAIGDTPSLIAIFNEYAKKDTPKRRMPYLDSQFVRTLLLLGTDMDGYPISFCQRTATQLEAIQIEFSERINRKGAYSPVQTNDNRPYYLIAEAYRYFHTNEERVKYAVPAIVEEIHTNGLIGSMSDMLKIFQCWGFKIERGSDLAKKIHEIILGNGERHSVHDFLDDEDAAAFLLKQELEKKNGGHPSADFN